MTKEEMFALKDGTLVWCIWPTEEFYARREVVAEPWEGEVKRDDCGCCWVYKRNSKGEIVNNPLTRAHPKPDGVFTTKEAAQEEYVVVRRLLFAEAINITLKYCDSDEQKARLTTLVDEVVATLPERLKIELNPPT